MLKSVYDHLDLSRLRGGRGRIKCSSCCGWDDAIPRLFSSFGVPTIAEMYMYEVEFVCVVEYARYSAVPFKCVLI
jgi:hypothetical protein